MPLITDFTPQENLIGQCLDTLGIRYAQQVKIGKYTVDFVVEGDIILEADGTFGHYREKDRQRDEELLELENQCYNRVIHIKKQTKEGIRTEIVEYFGLDI